MSNSALKKSEQSPFKQKSPSAYRTIGEAAAELKVPTHVLRFWETKFAQIQPVKGAGARRYYRPEDMTVLREIHNLLYSQGFTIKGAENYLKDKNRPAVAVIESQDTLRPLLIEALQELKSLRAIVAQS